MNSFAERTVRREREIRITATNRIENKQGNMSVIQHYHNGWNINRLSSEEDSTVVQ